ncbi:bifunctional 4-hydroxy-2-oxoglutarate aldolase/2-dehydro-3-deoxy-phosphogluconate aldolase [Malikia spinosa]|uniref:2-dehydro-3-deoxy-phosphogluconate aldolase n=1 Tax=Malikia spinosa TaxID=86180 RepID=A0A7C9JL01_9BURK|nr:bifunctional 4-hydroxy-2-oxoglutarate aldolase/2-dehydro-3-deoxy-phosphogluconate aldolase [Malikia spinosa]MYZ51706.1 bifunctional 4-hydroxy-2-oxoglutarate aldolase/2-dehydro-3-deoxy-phosphogluconate aldolase [Malikia spinosa]
MNSPAPLPLFQSRVVPVIVVTDPAQAVPMAEALLAGGVDVMEITLRSAAGLAAIEAVARAVPEMQVGAGTVTRASEVAQVLAAGARFGLSPGSTPELLAAVLAAGLPFVPGVASPSEAMAARDAGFTLMKCFPAAQLGGVEVLKAWGGPLPDLRFCPTGGVSLANMGSFLALPNVAMVGGSWLTPAAAVKAGDWAQITRLAREATDAVAALQASR